MPANRLNEYQMYKMFLVLLFMWMFTVLIELTNIKGYWIFHIGVNESTTRPSWLLVLAFIGLLLNPLDTMYKPFRYQLLNSLLHNIIAPFGLVRFKDFFIGDVLTSMVRPLIDVYYMGCYFKYEEWGPSLAHPACRPSNYAVLLISLIPFHIRFWQCINRFYYTGMWFPHLVNAGKYLTSVAVMIIAYLKTVRPGYEYIYVIAALISTIYSLAWDLKMDWGLLRGTKPGRRLLRDRLKYPHSYYYFAIVANTLLRLTWVLAFIP